MSILTLTTMICVVLININGSHTVPICCTKPLPELVEVHEKYECFDIKLQVKMPCPEREPMKDPDSEVFNANAKPERSEKILGSFQNENPVKNTSEFISLASWLPSFSNLPIGNTEKIFLRFWIFAAVVGFILSFMCYCFKITSAVIVEICDDVVETFEPAKPIPPIEDQLRIQGQEAVRIEIDKL